MFYAFSEVGIAVEPAVFHDDFADEVQAQLRRLDDVFVWSNPIESGRRRDRLDAMLREMAQSNVFFSTHPDILLRLGTKDVLLDVRGLPFGSDVVRVDSLAQLAHELPHRLLKGPRVLKQYRGHSSIGVGQVERQDGSGQRSIRHANRGSEEECIDMQPLLQRLVPYFEPEYGGHMVDQA